MTQLTDELRGPVEVCGQQCSFRISHFAADYEATADLLGSLGPSSNKPCAFCKNILAKRSVIPERDNYFCSLDESSVGKFDLIQSDDFHRTWDDLRSQAVLLPKTKQKELESPAGVQDCRERTDVAPTWTVYFGSAVCVLGLLPLLLCERHCKLGSKLLLDVDGRGDEHQLE